MENVYLGFLIAAIALIIIALILRLARQRLWSQIIELFAYVCFFVFSCQWTPYFAELDDLTVTKAMYILAFIFALVLLINKIILFIKYRSL